MHSSDAAEHHEQPISSLWPNCNCISRMLCLTGRCSTSSEEHLWQIKPCSPTCRIIGTMDQKSVETTWAQRGFSCGLWTDAPGHRWENFVHSVDELVMVVDGNVEFEIG